jgi:hypothetical protein
VGDVLLDIEPCSSERAHSNTDLDNIIEAGGPPKVDSSIDDD